jgi:hypothetical protein
VRRTYASVGFKALTTWLNLIGHHEAVPDQAHFTFQHVIKMISERSGETDLENNKPPPH